MDNDFPPGHLPVLLEKRGIESWERVIEKNLEANHAKNACCYLYEHMDKEGKKKMIGAWQKSLENN